MTARFRGCVGMNWRDGEHALCQGRLRHAQAAANAPALSGLMMVMDDDDV